jgi:uncharacterized protein (TIGR02145 family)
MDTLTTVLGGSSVAGGKLKATGTAWASPNTGANNSSGFTALPGGLRYYNGTLYTYGDNSGFWWSSVEYNTSDAFYCLIDFNSNSSNVNYLNKQFGFSVRCLRD